MGRRILVIEDEFIIGQNLVEILNDIGYSKVTHVFDAEEALAYLKGNKIDIVMLDINLGAGMDGIEFAKLIEQAFALPFIFLTSHADTATILRARESHPKAYLMKPFKKVEIFAALEIVFANLEEKEKDKTVFVKTGSTSKKIAVQDILFLKADRVYVEIHRRGTSPLIVRESLQIWEGKLPNYFKRINRSYIVNLQEIEKVGKRSIQISGLEISISVKVGLEIQNHITA